MAIAKKNGWQQFGNLLSRLKMTTIFRQVIYFLKNLSHIEIHPENCYSSVNCGFLYTQPFVQF